METKAVHRLREQQAKSQMSWEQLNIFALQEGKMLEGLEAIEEVEIRWSDYPSLDVSAVGNREKLIEIWKILRRAGFHPDARPAANASGFTAFFRKDGVPSVYFQFSSTVCRRVQVGTKTVEIPVYETICDEEENLQIPPESEQQPQAAPCEDAFQSPLL